MQRHIPLAILGALAIASLAIWYVNFSQEKKGELLVAFLDVGQGDAIFIEAPNGNQILIDGGPNRSVLHELASVMPFYDRSIDVVIATHPDADHIGGLVEILRRFSVAHIIDSGVSGDTAVFRAFETAAESEAAARYLARRGMVIDLGDEAKLRILFPDRDVSGIDTNTASIVAQLIYGETEFLFTGDSPKAVEEYLAQIDGKNLESDVLKIGHHGSRTSTAATFLGFVSPKFGVLSVGKDNRYGHPHAEVMELLSRFEIPPLFTSDGMVVFVSDGIRVRVK